MRSSLLALSAGFAIGAVAAYAVFEFDVITRDADERPSPVIENVPVMSREAAELHRAGRYSEIRTIEETLALPGDFAQTEALYALAGRSGSADIQDLIFQANGITDPSDRKAALDILFLRLTELDVRSALALSQTRDFRADRQIETRVWYGWARLDLEAALAAATALESSSDRNLAAQALLAAYDYQGNAATAYIEDILGIGPNSSTLASYLFQVGDRDPVEAIAIINEMSPPTEQLEAASYLGHRLGQLDGARAERHADLFRNFQTRRVFTIAVTTAAAESDPEAVLDEFLSGRPDPEQSMYAHGALQTLASRDIDKAIDYLERIPNLQLRASLAGAVAGAFAQANPDGAVAWAREYDDGMRTGVFAEVLSAIAATRPEMALNEANSIGNTNHRRMALNRIAMTMSERDPQQAVALLGQVGRPADREDMARSIAMMWVQSDPDAALSWMTGLEGPERESVLRSAAQWVPEFDLDTAMRWLPRLDEETQRTWRARIASSLAAQGSIQEARSFLARFEGSEDYPSLLASAIDNIAQNDITAAAGMAELLPAGPERDSLYGRIASEYSYQDPQQAASLLGSISDENERAQATGTVAMMWSQHDPVAAEQWAGSLPRGAARDTAIMSQVSTWDEMTPSRRLLVNSIGDPERRKQALITHVHTIAQSDPQQAERLMHDMDLSADERQQLREEIEMIQAYQ
jgi:hypothetical protein